MAVSEFETHRLNKIVSTYSESIRPPSEIREELDVGYRITGQSVELFQSQPALITRGKRLEIPVAKFTFVKSQGIWKLYWHRQDLRWHRYEPAPERKTIEQCLGVVEKDGCTCTVPPPATCTGACVAGTMLK